MFIGESCDLTFFITAEHGAGGVIKIADEDAGFYVILVTGCPEVIRVDACVCMAGDGDYFQV